MAEERKRTIRTRDGIVISDIPESVPNTDPMLKEMVDNIRATTGPGQYSFENPLPAANVPPPAPPAPTTQAPPLQPGNVTSPRAALAIAEQQAAGAPPISTQPPVPTPTQEGEEPRTDMMGLLGGAARGAAPIAAGALLGAPLGPVGSLIGAGAAGVTTALGDPIIDTINSWFGTKYTRPTDALNDLFTRLGVANPDTAAERVVQATSQGAAAAGSTVALGQALQHTPGLAQTVTKGIGRVLADSPAAQYGGGIGSAAAAQTTQELGGGPLAQTGAALAGGLLGSSIGNVRTAPVNTQVIDDAADVGVDIMTSDVRPPSTFAGKWLQTAGERIPVFGTGALRSNQQAQRVTAVRDIIRQYGADDIAALSDDLVDDLLSARRTQLTRLYGMREEVIESLADVDMPVDVQRTLGTIENEITKLEGLRLPELDPVISRLRDWANAIDNQDLGNIEQIRRQLSESFSAPALTNVRSIGERALTNIYGALRQDMSDYVARHGDDALLTKWTTSNNRLAELTEDLGIPALKRVLNRGETTPETINQLLFSQNRSDVVRLYRDLTDAGRARARTAILARAAERAGGEITDPDRFVREVRRLGNQTGIFFREEDARQLEGLMRVLEVTGRATASNRAPSPTAQSIIPLSAAGLASFFGGGLQGFLGTLAAAGTGGVIARAYESAPVRNILVQIPRVARGSAQEAALFKRLLETLRATSATRPTPEGGGFRLPEPNENTNTEDLIQG